MSLASNGLPPLLAVAEEPLSESVARPLQILSEAAAGRKVLAAAAQRAQAWSPLRQLYGLVVLFCGSRVPRSVCFVACFYHIGYDEIVGSAKRLLDQGRLAAQSVRLEQELALLLESRIASQQRGRTQSSCCGAKAAKEGSHWTTVRLYTLKRRRREIIASLSLQQARAQLDHLRTRTTLLHTWLRFVDPEALMTLGDGLVRGGLGSLYMACSFGYISLAFALGSHVQPVARRLRLVSFGHFIRSLMLDGMHRIVPQLVHHIRQTPSTTDSSSGRTPHEALSISEVRTRWLDFIFSSFASIVGAFVAFRTFAYSEPIATSMIGAASLFSSLRGDEASQEEKGLVAASRLVLLHAGIASIGCAVQIFLNSARRQAARGRAGHGSHLVNAALALQDLVAFPFKPLERFINRHKDLLISLRFNL